MNEARRSPLPGTPAHRRREAEHVLVDRRTPKRVRIIIRRNLVYLARYVTPERLERRGGLLDAADDRR